MASNKKYYWLKLKSDFFEDDTIQFIEEQENGILYVNFYLKLCLKSLKYDGKLVRIVGNTLIPYDVKSLSKLTGTDVDTVRVAMEIFKKIGLVEILDSGEIYLSQINEMIGSETDKAQIMRRKRAEQKLLSNNVTEALPKCYTEIEKEIEIEKELELEQEIEIEQEPIISLIQKDGELYHIYSIDDYIDTYKYIDVMEELKKMKLWLQSNPTKRKKDMPRFINGWLCRENDKLKEKKEENKSSFNITKFDV